MARGTRQDLSQMELPKAYTFEGVDFADEVERVARVMVIGLQNEKLIKNNESFGLMVANPLYAGRFHQIWNDPTQLAGFAIGWGPEAKRYQLNALRKIRASARTSCDTLFLKYDVTRGRDYGNRFQNTVNSQESDGTMLWGDYGHGGACFAGEDQQQWLVGVSSLEEAEDDMVASAVARHLFGRMGTLTELFD